ncbi:MAG: BrnA antitoxin family protein [Nitrospirae bacterium]|nr:BrnA antitoxin family protein [Nitrospirota bacterium]
MKKKIPKFKNENEERAFWATHDSTEFIDWEKAKRTLLPRLKPSVKTISLRLPEAMLEELRLLANKRDVPYQSKKNLMYIPGHHKALVRIANRSRTVRSIQATMGRCQFNQFIFRRNIEF